MPLTFLRGTGLKKRGQREQLKSLERKVPESPVRLKCVRAHGAALSENSGKVGTSCATSPGFCVHINQGKWRLTNSQKSV